MEGVVEWGVDRDSSRVRFVERLGSDSDKWRRYEGEDVVPVWVADSDVEAAEVILEAVRQRVNHGVFGYSAAPEGMAECVVEYFARRWGFSIEAEWIVYSPGLGAAIHAVCRMAGAMDSGADILTPSPIYHVFRKAPPLAAVGRRDVVMTLGTDGRWQLTMESLETAVTPHSRVLQLCNPHNPNGKVYSKAELEGIADFCLRHDLLICADEVHADLILDEDERHVPIASLSPEVARRTITLQSPSKAFNVAGLNFAVVVIADDELRQRYRQATAGKVISHLNPLGYAAAMAAWGGAADDWLAESVAIWRDNRDALSQAVAGMEGIRMPHLSATCLAWLDVAGLKVDSPPDFFRANGLGLSAGGDFGDASYMRLNFGCSPARLQEVIRRLRQAVARAHSAG